jgi:hypothetical protein
MLSAKMNLYIGGYLSDLLQYGPLYLDKKEFDMILDKTLNSYYGYLAVNAFRHRGAEFWEYHRKRLAELGFPITTWSLVRGFVRKGLGMLGGEVRELKRFFASIG